MTRIIVALAFVSLIWMPGSIRGQSDLPLLHLPTAGALAHLPVGELNRIQVMVRFGRPEEALQTFDALLTQQPDWVAAIMERALILNRLGRPEEARLNRERAARIDPIAADFYGSRSTSSLLPFIALYPNDWFSDRYRAGELKTDIQAEPNLAAFRRGQIAQLEGVNGQSDLTLEFLKRKSTGERNLPGDDFAQSANHSRQWRDLMLGNLALLRQDLHLAIRYYNDAELSGANWPELYYNRGLTHILLNNLVSGCNDLSVSYRGGFAPGETMLRHLCNF